MTQAWRRSSSYYARVNYKIRTTSFSSTYMYPCMNKWVGTMLTDLIFHEALVSTTGGVENLIAHVSVCPTD